MHILMLTNTFTPHVGGVARSVEAFAAAYRAREHRVLVVAPEFENMPAHETDVIRVPAIQNFNGSDFSMVLPVPGSLHAEVAAFAPDVIHSHHAFLLGGTALRLAHRHERPIVFTHHTMYEQYTHYVPGDCQALKRFVMSLTTSYANLCDHVVAPSESVAEVIRGRGVTSPIAVIPTGVDVDLFRRGSGRGLRAALGIPEDAFVIGHTGRLAPEKNLPFLAEAVSSYLRAEPAAHFLVVGAGPSAETVRRMFAAPQLRGRLHLVGSLQHPLLASAYRAMDVFAFASRSETQGMVLTEAMAASVPVVALDGPGVREVVEDRVNGRLLAGEDARAFAAALAWVRAAATEQTRALRAAAERTAGAFALGRCCERMLVLYDELRDRAFVDRTEEYGHWSVTRRLIRAEWEVIKGFAEAAGAALSPGEEDDAARSTPG